MAQTKKAKSQVFGVIALVLAILAVIFSLVGFFDTPVNVRAGYVKEFNFQGRLTNPDGTNVTDGVYDMNFRIYNVSSGGVAMWSENHIGGNKVTVEDGVFNVNLGSLNAINLDFNSGVYYLGIEVNGDGEMSPRRRIGGVGYSLNTERVYGVPGSLTDTNIDSFPVAERGILDALNYLNTTAIPAAGMWEDSSGNLHPKAGVSQDVSIPNGRLHVSGAVSFDSTLGVTGATTLSSTLIVTGAATLSSTLGVTGATDLSSTLSVSNTTNLIGAVTFGTGVTSYTFPTTRGSNNQILITDGSGNVTWQNQSSGFLDPMTTRGDIIYRNAANTTTRLGAGLANTVLMSDGTDISYQPFLWEQTGIIIHPYTLTDDFAIGANSLVAPFSVDENLNTVRIGEGSAGAATNAILNMYASNDATGSVTYTTDDRWEFTGGNIYANGGVVGIGVAPSSARSLNIANAADNGYGVYTAMTGTVGTIYGNYISVSGASTTNYGLYSTASGATTNYGGYFSGTTYGVYIASGATSDELYVDGTANFTGNVDAENGLDITNAALTMGSQNITGVGTNITATAGLTIGSTGATNDITLLSTDKIYFQDALITTAIPFALTDNTAAFEAAFGAADRGVIDALISLASGGTGLWLDDVGSDYLYPNSTYSNNVSVASGIMSIGTTPTAGRSLNIANASNNGYGVYTAMTGATGTIHGQYISATGASTTNYGMEVSVSGAATTNYGSYIVATGATSNYAGYFDVGTGGAGSDVGIYGRVQVGNAGDDYGAILGISTAGGGNNYGATVFLTDGSGSDTNTGLDVSIGTGTAGVDWGIRVRNNNAGTGTNYGGVLSVTGTGDANYGGYLEATGASTTNYGLYSTASGATTNYGGYFSGTTYGVYIASGATSDELYVDGTANFTGNVDAENGLDITNAALTMGSQNITGVGTNITATAGLTIGSTGATNDITLLSTDKIYFQDALITTAIPFALTDNTAAFEAAFGAADRGVIDALISLASGGTGLWLDDVGSDYLYPNSTYSNNVSVASGIMSIGTTPTAGRSLNIANASNNGYGVYTAMTGATGTIYGNYISLTGASTVNNGVYLNISNAVAGESTNYGVNAVVANAVYNYGGQFTVSGNGTANYGIHTTVSGSTAGINEAFHGSAALSATLGDVQGYYFSTTSNDGINNGLTQYGIYDSFGGSVASGATATTTGLYVRNRTTGADGTAVPTAYGIYSVADGSTNTYNNYAIYASASGATNYNEAFHGEATLGATVNGARGMYMATTVSGSHEVSQYGFYNSFSGTGAFEASINYSIYATNTFNANGQSLTAYGIYGNVALPNGGDESVGVAGAAQGANSNSGGRFTVDGGGTLNDYGVYALLNDPGTSVSGNYGGYFSIIGVAGDSSDYGVFGYIDNAGNTDANYGGYFELNAGGSGDDYGILASVITGAAGTNYGGYFSVAGAAATDNYGVYGTASNTGTENYGVYGVSSGATGSNYGGRFNVTGAAGTDYAGFFQAGANAEYGLYVIGGTTQSIYADGDAFIVGGLGVGTAEATDGYLRASRAGIGVAANAAYGINVAEASADGRGINIEQTGATGTNYGIYLSVPGSATVNYGLYASIDRAATQYGVYGATSRSSVASYGVYGSGTGNATNYGIYGTASGGTTNWAGYFDSGNVNIVNTLFMGGVATIYTDRDADFRYIGVNIAHNATYPLYVSGDAYVTGGLGVGTAETTDGYLRATRGGFGVAANAAYGMNIADASASGRGINISETGASGTKYGVYSSVTGAGTSNTAVYATASGGTANYAGIFDGGYVGIGDTTPSYKLDLYDHASNLQYGAQFDFLSTYNAGDYQSALYAVNSSTLATADTIAGITGNSNGAGAAGYNTGVYGRASNNTNQNVAIYGSAESGSGSNWGGYFDVLSAVTGNKIGVQGNPGTANDGKSTIGVKAAMLTASVHTTYDTDEALGMSGYLGLDASLDYNGVYAENHAGKFILGNKDGYTLKDVTAGMDVLNVGFYNQGTVTTDSGTNFIAGVNGWVGGTAGDSYSNSDLYGVVGTQGGNITYNSTVHFNGIGGLVDQTSLGYNIGVVGLATGAALGNTGGTFLVTTGGAAADYGVSIDVNAAAAGNDMGLSIAVDEASNSGTDYVAWLDPEDYIEYGLYIDAGATVDSINSVGTYSDTVGVTNRDLYVDNAGTIGYVSSSLRYKNNVKNINNIAWLYQLRPVSFEYKKYPGAKQEGLIAEEVQQVNPAYVSYDAQGRPETVSYGNLVTPLIQSAKEQEAAIVDMNEEITNIKKQLETLTAGTGQSGALQAGQVVGDLGITGKVTIGGDIDIAGTLKASSLWSNNATWHIDSLGEAVFQKVTAGDIEIQEGENKAIGSVTLPGNKSEIFVPNNSVTAASRIFLTIESSNDANTGVKVKEKRAGQGFVISTNDGKPAPVDLPVNWLVIN